MSKGGSQTQTTSLDPASQAYVQQMRQYAQGAVGLPGTASYSDPARAQQLQTIAAKGGPMGDIAKRELAAMTQGGGASAGMPALPQGIQDAQNQYNQYAQGGNLGFSALTGDTNAAQQFMNPYTSQMNPFFAQQRALAVQGANDQATQMGAFGGDRSQIGAAVAGGQADQNAAAFRVNAFEDAMRRAGFAANLGYGAQAQSAFLPQQYYSGQLGLLNQGMGPYGQTSTTKTSSDPFSQMLGLGLTLFGPGGLLAGGALGAGGLAALAPDTGAFTGAGLGGIPMWTG